MGMSLSLRTGFFPPAQRSQLSFPATNSQDPRFNAGTDELPDWPTGSALVAPLTDHDRQVTGVLLAANAPGAACFTDTDEKNLQAFLTFCGIGLRNAKLFQQSQLETRRNQVLLDLVRIIFEQQENLDLLVQNILHYMQVITSCTWCQVLLIDDPASTEGSFDRVFELRHDSSSSSSNGGAENELTKCRLLINSEIAQHVCITGEPLSIAHAGSDARLTEQERASIRSLLCLPIRNAQSQVAGLCLLMNPADGDPFAPGDLQLAEAFALFCGLGIHSVRTRERAEVAQRRQRVALDVLGYHACASTDEAQRLARCLIPSARYLGINEFRFTNLALSEDDTLACAIKVFQEAGMFATFQLDYQTFCRWLLSVRKNYRPVAYHNWRHAFDVTQCAFNMLRTSPELHQVSPLEKLALLVASLCHDLDHRGTDNRFQKLTLSPLAQLYSSSMLERHHFNQCTMLLSLDGCDILSNLSPSQYNACIGTVEKCILATDLQLHFECRPRLQDLTAHGQQLNWSDIGHRQLLFGLVMTCADLSAIAKPWPVQQRIAQLVAKEFHEQGDRERSELNLQPDDTKDRAKHECLPAMQIAFIDSVCLPAYELLCSLCSNLEELKQGCQSNRCKWLSLASESP